MKGIIVGFFLLLIALTGVYVFGLREMYRDHGRDILIAFGVPIDDTIQMHVCVPIGTYMKDPPRLGPNDRLLIREWVEEHYQLCDDSEQRLPLERYGSSGLLEDARAATAAEFFLMVTLKKGQDYTLDFVPKVREPDRYRYEFTAPSEPQDPLLTSFLPVTED